jgi:hypothetical protein
MDYFAKWFDDIQSRVSLCLPSKIGVTGVYRQHLGPRFAYAKIEACAEPASSLEIRFGADVCDSGPDRLFLEAAIFGLLDALLTSESSPLRNVRITLTRCEVDPIDSSQMAFRHAGRDAGRKIISEIGERDFPETL